MGGQAGRRARLEAAAAALVDLRPRVEVAGPWPLAERFGVEPEAAWGPPELLAHVAEMLPYWLGEAERVLDGGSSPAPFGRLQSDPVRVSIIGRDRTVPPRELFSRIASDARRWAGRLAELSDADLDRRGLHPSRGELPLSELVDRFVIDHLEEHVAQLRAILAGTSAAGG